jgi:hypothetical protein
MMIIISKQGNIKISASGLFLIKLVESFDFLIYEVSSKFCFLYVLLSLERFTDEKHNSSAILAQQYQLTQLKQYIFVISRTHLSPLLSLLPKDVIHVPL